MTNFKKIFHLMESIDPTYRNYLLNEDKRTDQAKARCLQVIRNHFNNASWLDNIFNHQDNPQGLSYIDYMFKQFMDEFYHDPNYRKRAVMRLAPLFCKLAFEANFQNTNPDTDKLNKLSTILFLIYNMDEQGKNISSKIDIDNTSFDDLNNQFGTIIDDLKNQEEERMDNNVYELNPDYEVIGPVDYETAHEYGEKSCSISKLCYTQSESTWDRYSRNGCNNVYIILKKGWENIPEQHDDASESAYDTYGLSMIFVFVDGSGGLAYCNTRWNHKAKYASGFSCDHAMNREQISELIGARFNDVFKPNNKFAELIADIQRRLSNREPIENVFDYVGRFYEGYAPVEIEDVGWNFINKENKILRSNQWFDEVENFKDGLAKVYIIGEGYNWIKTDSKFLRDDLWFNEVFDFKDGCAAVEIKGKGYNFIKTDGEILRDDLWFDDVHGFRNGLAPVKIKRGRWNYINTDGKFPRPDLWFDNAYSFYEGYALVYIENKGFNWIKTDGKYLRPDLWFDKAWFFFDGCAKVHVKDRGWNYIKTDGEYLRPDIWFDFADNFVEGFAKVYIKDRGYNFIKTDGNFLRDDLWFNSADFFRDKGYALVKIGDSKYKIDTNGILYDDEGNRVDIPVQESKKYNSKRNVIKLTESDLHRVIKESVKKVLREYN